MKKGKISTIILIVVFCVGLSLLLYPTVSDYWNSLHQTRAIARYTKQVDELNADVYEQLWQDAQNYNQTLLNRANRYKMTEAERAEYESLLNVSGNGIIGYIQIEKINCTLPVYHGTAESALQIAVGHIEGTSLPVGGESTHCVISGHRGLPRAKLFTDLDKMEEGDTFTLHILNETLTYEVDQIRVVEPNEMENLDIEEGKDYCTLVTCTPYGINTHRLLVRGHRTENRRHMSADRITSDAMALETTTLLPLLVVPIVIILLLWLLMKTRRRK